MLQPPLADISALDPKLKTSYTEQFSFGVQRQIPLGLFVETSYVGNLGRHLIRQPDINYPDFALQAANAALPSSQQAATNYLRPYKGFSAINDYISDSTSNYHSLQVFRVQASGRRDIHIRIHMVEGAGRFQRVRRSTRRTIKTAITITGR